MKHNSFTSLEVTIDNNIEFHLKSKCYCRGFTEG